MFWELILRPSFDLQTFSSEQLANFDFLGRTLSGVEGLDGKEIEGP